MKLKDMKKELLYDDYYEIRDILSIQYGEPENEDSLSKEASDDLGFNNNLITEWLAEDRTMVKLDLTYENDIPKIDISYY